MQTSVRKLPQHVLTLKGDILVPVKLVIKGRLLTDVQVPTNVLCYIFCIQHNPMFPLIDTFYGYNNNRNFDA